ncbi:hypothetical protein E0F15_10210 [Frankia sp. B2]|nr:hypothetical protein E0F15_10210 [Frankia sp. B2]
MGRHVRYALPGLGRLTDFTVLAANDGWNLLHLQTPPVMPFDASEYETSYDHASSTRQRPTQFNKVFNGCIR